jgi:hypothetical protein
MRLRAAPTTDPTPAAACAVPLVNPRRWIAGGIRRPALPCLRFPLFMLPMSDRITPRSAWRGRQRSFLLNADQHRRLAALLRRGTVPGREEQALHHERLAAAIDQHERQTAELRTTIMDSQAGVTETE